MKKIKMIYLTVAIALVAVFFYTATKRNFQQIIIEAIPHQVGIMGQKKSSSINPETFESRLDQFAKEHHSLVARRLIVPSDGTDKVNFQYQTFGKGELPANMARFNAGRAPFGDPPHFGDTYLVISGPLNSVTLSKFLNSEFPLHAAPFPTAEHWRQTLMAFGDWNTLPMLLILFLSFFCLSLFSKISELRNVGIRLLSGRKHVKLAFQDYGGDAILIISVSAIVFACTCAVLYSQRLTNSLLFIMLGYSFWFIALGFLIISFLVSLLIFLVLKRSNLTSLVKGKLPTWQLMATSGLLWGVIISLLMSSLTQVEGLESTLKRQSEQSAVWEHYAKYLNVNAITLGTSKDDSAWWAFYNDQIENQGALLVDYSNAVSPYKYQDTAGGNYLFVSPAYLKLLQVEGADAYSNMNEGSYGLILPEKFKNNESQLVSGFDKSITSITGPRGHSEEFLAMHAIVSYVPNKQKRFIFNNMWLSPSPDDVQVIEDPILVVLSPAAMGKNSSYFWSDEINSIYFPQEYSQLAETLKKFSLYSEVSYIQGGARLFKTYIAQAKSSITLQLANVVMTALLSLIFFGLIISLYLAHFRREIAIKRLSGLHFFQVHRRFMIVSVTAMLFVGASLGLLFHDFNLSALVGLVQVGLSACLLSIQAHRAERHHMDVLKGE